MKRFVIGLIAVAALVLAGVVPVEAQIPFRTMTQLAGDLSTACAAGNITYQLVIVTDAASSTDCSTGSGDGTTPSVCWCIDGAFAALSAATSADLSGYVLITKAGQQAITATGAGNDITLTAADDVILASTDALTITAASGTVAATTTFAIDAAGGTDELGIAEGLVGLMGINFYGAHMGPTALGVTCDAGAAGDFYYDTETELEMCFCNATNWVKFSDASTQCGDPN